MNFSFQFLDFSTLQLSFVFHTVFHTFHLYFIHLYFIPDKFDSGEINTVGSSKEPHYKSFRKNNNFFMNEALKEFNPFFFL